MHAFILLAIQSLLSLVFVVLLIRYALAYKSCRRAGATDDVSAHAFVRPDDAWRQKKTLLRFTLVALCLALLSLGATIEDLCSFL